MVRFDYGPMDEVSMRPFVRPGFDTARRRSDGARIGGEPGRLPDNGKGHAASGARRAPSRRMPFMCDGAHCAPTRTVF